MLKTAFLQHYEKILVVLKILLLITAALLFLMVIASRTAIPATLGYYPLIIALVVTMGAMMVVELLGYYLTREFYYLDKEAFRQAAKKQHGVQVQALKL